ncbi:hypothetical protein FQZ97_964990 [compost metagenome]
MLHYRHEFYMGKACFFQVGHQGISYLPVIQLPFRFGGVPPPGAQVNLIHGKGGVKAVLLPAVFHPVFVFPFIPGIPDHRGGTW